MKNIKIGTKLISGFIIVAVITLIVGFVGYRGMNNVMIVLDEIGDVDLPGIRDLLTIEVAQATIDGQENLLLATNISDALRDKAYEIIAEAKGTADEAWQDFEKHSHSDEEKLIWNEFVPAWNAWWNDHEQFERLAKEYEQNPTTENYDAMSNYALHTVMITFDKSDNLLMKLVSITEETATKDALEGDKIIEQAFTLLIIFVIIAIILALVIGIVITRAITAPLAKSVNFAEKIANGDLTANIDINQKDETGKLADSLKNMVEKLREVVEAVVNGANNIGSASEEMSSSSQEVSQGASEQASSAEEVSSSMEEMVSNIQQNTDNAQQTEKISAKAATDIIEGSNNVNQTVEAMKKIADKVAIISDIAFQTNILALNAAVEAARAGEHGKGFAVVAAEVRKLAERSQIAANEINGLSKSSVEIAEKSGKLLNAIVPDIQKTSKLVQEITAASIEQNSGADQINNAINQLNQVTQQNAAASEEMATSAEELSSQAEQLQEVISFFKIDNKDSKTRMTSNITSKKNSNIKVAHLDKKKIIANSYSKKGAELQMFDNKHDADFEKF